MRILARFRKPQPISIYDKIGGHSCDRYSNRTDGDGRFSRPRLVVADGRRGGSSRRRRRRRWLRRSTWCRSGNWNGDRVTGGGRQLHCRRISLIRIFGHAGGDHFGELRAVRGAGSGSARAAIPALRSPRDPTTRYEHAPANAFADPLRATYSCSPDGCLSASPRLSVINRRIVPSRNGIHHPLPAPVSQYPRIRV
jgi:hypothetical protein